MLLPPIPRWLYVCYLDAIIFRFYNHGIGLFSSALSSILNWANSNRTPSQFFPKEALFYVRLGSEIAWGCLLFPPSLLRSFSCQSPSNDEYVWCMPSSVLAIMLYFPLVVSFFPNALGEFNHPCFIEVRDNSYHSCHPC